MPRWDRGIQRSIKYLRRFFPQVAEVLERGIHRGKLVRFLVAASEVDVLKQLFLIARDCRPLKCRTAFFADHQSVNRRLSYAAAATAYTTYYDRTESRHIQLGATFYSKPVPCVLRLHSVEAL